MEDVAKVRSAKGEFLIVTFSGSTLLKRYTVKQKHLKSLGFSCETPLRVARVGMNAPNGHARSISALACSHQLRMPRHTFREADLPGLNDFLTMGA